MLGSVMGSFIDEMVNPFALFWDIDKFGSVKNWTGPRPGSANYYNTIGERVVI